MFLLANDFPLTGLRPVETLLVHFSFAQKIDKASTNGKKPEDQGPSTVLLKFVLVSIPYNCKHIYALT